MIKLFDKYCVAMSSALLLVSVLIVMVHLGVGLSFDTNSYSDYASELIEHNFNIISFVEDHYPRLATYSVPIYIMGFIKYLFGNSWKLIFLVLNFCCVAGMLWRFSSTLKQLDVSRWAIVVGILLATISIDHIVWPRFVLTDTLYSLMILYAFTLPIHINLSKAKNLIWFIVFLLVLMVTRPTSLPVVLACAAFALSYRSSWFLFKPAWMLSLLAILVCGFTLVWAYFFQQYSLGNIEASKNLDYIYRFVESGAIITERKGSSINISGAYSDYVYLYVLRLIYFFSPYSEDFSFIHNFSNTIWISSFFISLVMVLKLDKRGLLSHKQKKVIASLLVLIVAVACYHSAILIDYDWRYRYPLIFPMLMIVSIICSVVFKGNKQLKAS